MRIRSLPAGFRERWSVTRLRSSTALSSPYRTASSTSTSDSSVKVTREASSGTSSRNESFRAKSRRVVDRPPLEGDRLTGRERAVACRRRSSSFTFHFRRERAVDLDARSKDSHRDEVGSGSKRRVGLGGNDNLLRSRKDFVGEVVEDNPPILKFVVLAIADKQRHVGIGFQREGYAGGILGNFQLI